MKKSIKEEIDSGFKEFANYTITNRAIPSAIDGLKPVNRKLLYAMLQFPAKTKVKLTDLAISRYEYHHGDVSAQDAAVKMAQAWSNNAPLFDGHGNFGTRKVQEAAAPRYIFVTLGKTYETYFKDSHLAPKNRDHEAPEPQFYLPTIPWVLVNGIKGIAVGFATNILSRSPATLTKEVKEYLKSPKSYDTTKHIPPTFPDFRGEVEHVGGLTWRIRGAVEEVGAFYFKITELPYGPDRGEYVEFLNSLVDKGLINDYSDECSDAGFEFLIKVSRSQKEAIQKDPIKFFKLEKQVTENLTTIGIDGKIKEFETSSEIVPYFVDYRLGKFQESIDYDISEKEKEIVVLNDKIEFIKLVVADKNIFKKTKDELLTFIENNVTMKPHGKSFINIPIWAMTADSLLKLEEELVELNDQLGELMDDTAKARFLRSLSK